VTLDRITLKGMKFFSHSGLYPFEREVGQPIEVDVVCHMCLKAACETDQYQNTLDYAKIHEEVARIVEKGGHSLIEALANDIAVAVLAFDAVERVEVRCRKPNVRLPGIIDHVEVAIERGR
jgi:dihydroneopterin aldolase